MQKIPTPTLNLSAVAALASVPVSTLAAWVARGLIPGLASAGNPGRAGRSLSVAEALIVALFAARARGNVTLADAGGWSAAAAPLAARYFDAALAGERRPAVVVTVEADDGAADVHLLFRDDATALAAQLLELGRPFSVLPVTPLVERLAAAVVAAMRPADATRAVAE